MLSFLPSVGWGFVLLRGKSGVVKGSITCTIRRERVRRDRACGRWCGDRCSFWLFLVIDMVQHSPTWFGLFCRVAADSRSAKLWGCYCRGRLFLWSFRSFLGREAKVRERYGTMGRQISLFLWLPPLDIRSVRYVLPTCTADTPCSSVFWEVRRLSGVASLSKCEWRVSVSCGVEHASVHQNFLWYGSFFTLHSSAGWAIILISLSLDGIAFIQADLRDTIPSWADKS